MPPPSRSVSAVKTSDRLIRRFLATVCSALQYLHDRGELEDGKSATLRGFVTRVRYTRIRSVSHFDVVLGDRLVRIQATDIGPAPPGFELEDEDDDDAEEEVRPWPRVLR